MTILMLFNNRDKFTFEVKPSIHMFPDLNSIKPCLHVHEFNLHLCWLLTPSGDPAGDRHPRARTGPGPAVSSLWETHPESSHERAQEQRDRERPCVYSQWPVYLQTAQSQNTNRYCAATRGRCWLRMKGQNKSNCLKEIRRIQNWHLVNFCLSSICLCSHKSRENNVFFSRYMRLK